MDDASKHQPRVSLPSPDEVKPLLRKLWPHRTHESNWLKDVACRLGQHRWYAMTLNDSVSGLRIACTFCRFCTEVKVDGVQSASGNAQL
jgi:hypothetical protein